MRILTLGFGALAVNAGLFLALALANAREKVLPVTDSWAAYDVFHAEPPPAKASFAAEGGPRAAEVAAQEQAPADAAAPEPPATEHFVPRLALADFDAGALGSVPVPAPPVMAGDASLTAPGGIASALLGPGGGGGGGSGGAFSLMQVDRPPRRMYGPLPPYPHWATLRRLEGVVSLQFVVTADGSVRDVVIEAVEGDARFGAIARDAARRWQFEPALYGGRRVACVVTQRVRFQLAD